MNDTPKRCSALCKRFRTPECAGGTLVFTGQFHYGCFEWQTEEDGGRKQVNLNELAGYIVFSSPIRTDRRLFTMFRWDGRMWVDDAEGHIQQILAETEGAEYRAHHLTTLLQLVQAQSFVDDLREPPDYLIAFKNGVLNINTGELGGTAPSSSSGISLMLTTTQARTAPSLKTGLKRSSQTSRQGSASVRFSATVSFATILFINSSSLWGLAATGRGR